MNFYAKVHWRKAGRHRKAGARFTWVLSSENRELFCCQEDTDHLVLKLATDEAKAAGCTPTPYTYAHTHAHTHTGLTPGLFKFIYPNWVLLYTIMTHLYFFLKEKECLLLIKNFLSAQHLVYVGISSKRYSNKHINKSKNNKLNILTVINAIQRIKKWWCDCGWQSGCFRFWGQGEPLWGGDI